ncbi:MAG: nuclease family protein [Polaromonas sp.]|nr:nuclease family protein [Polaromonas sp.]
MTSIANTLESLSPTAQAHPGDACWAHLMAELASVLQSRALHPARAVVLVPYAQLMQEARGAWMAHAAASGAAAVFIPRFETTMNWATSLSASQGSDAPSGDDIQLDVALDALTAGRLLARAGLASQQQVLGGRLLEAAWSLARVAAAQPPDRRLDWGVRLAGQLGIGVEAPALALELAVARIAVAWAAASAYPTDPLFAAGTDVDLLVVVEGFQSEPLAEALKTVFADQAVSLRMPFPDRQGALALHASRDAEDEAHRAAACVLAHLAQGRVPVALVAQDRVLTRRVRAMLAESGVLLRDETGWKLSTTRAAATLMGLLRAVPWDAASDAVLDWLKNAPAFQAADVTRLEVALRRAGVRSWRALPTGAEELAAIAAQVQVLREALQRPRPLQTWLRDLRAALDAAGQWQPLADDAAGAAVLDALRVHGDQESALPEGLRMSLHEFTSWANQTLEAASFSPTHPPEAQVVILPLSQLLGRPLQAVVLPGADEVRLAVSPEPPGAWTPAQRELLGLPSRVQTADAVRASWDYALRMPAMDVLWRTSDGGERLMPSGFVQEVLLRQSPPMANDPRIRRELAVQPTPRPLPTGDAFPVSRLSASAYEDLRRCPYRFFALRQLRLQEAEELESELGKREFGNWLHMLLHGFHEALKAAPTPDPSARLAMINIAAEGAAMTLGLADSEFLPFAAIWPRVRDGYLQWLAGHEAAGATYVEGEAWKEMAYGGITLLGKVDRIDHLADGSRLVMDYKTEARTTTQERVRDGREDTQLAFYAALLPDDTLSAAYVNLGERGATRPYDQPEIVQLRDELVDSILVDVSRIAAGAPLPALGEGKACEYCAARGLCRKDFWTR